MPPPEMVVLGALPMAFKTHAAIMHLCRLGYAQDAEALVRTLFELAVDLRYMLQAEDCQECAQRWLDWARVVQHKLWGVLDLADAACDRLGMRGDNETRRVERRLGAGPPSLAEAPIDPTDRDT